MTRNGPRSLSASNKLEQNNDDQVLEGHCRPIPGTLLDDADAQGLRQEAIHAVPRCTRPMFTLSPTFDGLLSHLELGGSDESECRACRKNARMNWASSNQDLFRFAQEVLPHRSLSPLISMQTEIHYHNSRGLALEQTRAVVRSAINPYVTSSFASCRCDTGVAKPQGDSETHCFAPSTL